MTSTYSTQSQTISSDLSQSFPRFSQEEREAIKQSRKGMSDALANFNYNQWQTHNQNYAFPPSWLPIVYDNSDLIKPPIHIYDGTFRRWLLNTIKKTMFKMSRKVIKVVLTRQQSMNDVVVNLTQGVILLESRVLDLERRLATLEQPPKSSRDQSSLN